MEIPFQNRWLTLAIVSAALFLVVIDMTVLYTALPSLAQALRTTASEKLWILNAYSLVMAGLMPVLGALGDRIGHRRIFIAGMVVFVNQCIGCGCLSMKICMFSNPGDRCAQNGPGPRRWLGDALPDA